MISLGPRYVEYGLVGGFFLFAIVGFLTWQFPTDAYGLLLSLKAIADDLPEGFASIFASLLIAAIVVIIFLFGLLIDLLGSSFIVWELRILRNNLLHEQKWICNVLNNYDDFLDFDFALFLQEFTDPLDKEEAKKALKTVTNLIFFWKRAYWIEFLDGRPITRAIKRFKYIKPLSRLETVLLWHLYHKIEPARLETLTDSIRICRITRSILSGLAILTIVLYINTLSTLWVDIVNRELVLNEIIGICIFFSLILFLSAILTIRVYSRYYLRLFSCLYVLYRNENSLCASHETKQQVDTPA